jgi:Tfp pilus assembly pilus retraction ATPase PilT
MCIKPLRNAGWPGAGGWADRQRQVQHLAAMIDHLNRERALQVITLEDPIEFIHSGQGCLVNQREIGATAATSPRVAQRLRQTRM